MILPKACPRCIGGDIIVRAEDTNMVATCFQCDYHRDFKPGQHPHVPHAVRHGRSVLHSSTTLARGAGRCSGRPA